MFSLDFTVCEEREGEKAAHGRDASLVQQNILHRMTFTNSIKASVYNFHEI